MMYAVMALDVLGYAPDHPVRGEALRQFNALMVDDGERFFFQPCFSPVWDTAIGAYALAESDSKHPGLVRAADWMLSREVRRRGDWAVKRPRTEPSGWAFFYKNELYPDIDDTAMVMLALSQARGSDAAAQKAAHQRAIEWLLAMQSCDGGWAAFDADNNWQFLNNVPFADHNAMLDPTCPDITGRALEALAAHGVENSHPKVRRGSGLAACATRRRTEAGMGVGALPTSTARASRCGAWRHRAKTTARRTSCARASGCARYRTPMADGARAAPATTMASSARGRARPRRPPGRFWG